jgi:pectate lyase
MPAGGASGAAGAAGKGGATGSGGATSTGGTTATGGSTGTGGTPGPALAFPGAEGFAKNVTGGRNGVVYHVTNLNDSGTGSFRDAVSSSGRIIVFDVGGYVQLQTAVSGKSNLTIAGQTAPGGGIGFEGGEISFASQSNIIVRHIRIRPGSDTASSTDDALSLYRAHDVIIDHTSLSTASATTGRTTRSPTSPSRTR